MTSLCCKVGVDASSFSGFSRQTQHLCYERERRSPGRFSKDGELGRKGQWEACGFTLLLGVLGTGHRTQHGYLEATVASAELRV